MKPFLKWAGNKYRIINKILPLMPVSTRLIEPFAGSCAVFLNTNYPEYIIADNNRDLINLYKILQTDNGKFIKYAKSFFIPENNTSEKYYQLRDLFNKTNDLYLKSALFLYLNRHGYNGLCRYNKQGIFNTPFGRYKKPYFPEKELINFINKCNNCNVEFICDDFENVMNMANSGDIIYCDPPYIPLNSTSNFTSYSTKGFTISDQYRLINLSRKLKKQGVYIVLSNHYTDFTQKEYFDADKIIKFNVQRFISCNGSNRSNSPEILAVYG